MRILLISACCVVGTQRQVASLAAEKQTLQDKLDASQASSSAMQADLSSQRDRALKAEAALAEAQARAHQLSEAAEHARQQKGEVERRVGQEKVQAEQQIVELRAVEGQLEAEVARLQQQLEGVQGQLQVTALCGDGLSAPALLCCVYACYLAFVSAHSLLLCVPAPLCLLKELANIPIFVRNSGKGSVPLLIWCMFVTQKAEAPGWV